MERKKNKSKQWEGGHRAAPIVDRNFAVQQPPVMRFFKPNMIVSIDVANKPTTRRKKTETKCKTVRTLTALLPPSIEFERGPRRAAADLRGTRPSHRGLNGYGVRRVARKQGDAKRASMTYHLELVRSSEEKQTLPSR